MSFFESLRRFFARTGQNGGSGGRTSSDAAAGGAASSGGVAPSGGSASSSGVASSGGSASSGSDDDAPDENAVAMISCEEASARLFEYLDGELEGMSEEEVRLHLEACEACYPRVQFEKHFLEALRRSKGGGRASESLRERVIQSLAEDESLD